MDDDDKVRRNLMILSAGLILYFWLGLPDSIVLRKVLGSDNPPTVAAWKVWTALLGMVLYQIHRYISVVLVTAAWTDAGEELAKRRKTFMRWLVNLEFRRLQSGKALHVGRIRESLFYGGEGKPRFDYSTATIAGIQEQNAYHYAASFSGSNSGPVVNPTLIVELPAGARWIADIAALGGMITTRFFSEFGIPLVAGGTAVLLCAGRLVWLAVV